MTPQRRTVALAALLIISLGLVVWGLASLRREAGSSQSTGEQTSPDRDHGLTNTSQSNSTLAPIPAVFSEEGIRNIGMIVGARFDRSSGTLHLIGDGKYPEASPTLEQIAVAFKWAFAEAPKDGVPEYNFVSIDPDPKNPMGRWMKVRTNPNALDTEFGWIMFEADRLLKAYSLGYDNITHARVDSGIQGYANILTISKSIFLPQGTQQQRWNRFWLYPKSNSVEMDDSAIYIREAVIGVCTEVMKLTGNQFVSSTGNYSSNFCGDSSQQERDPAAKAFSEFFTESYAAFANEEPVFRNLEQLMRLLLVSEWIRLKQVPVNLDWIERYRRTTFHMPRVTPTVNLQEKDTHTSGSVIRTQISNIFGGVNLDVKLKEIPAGPEFNRWTSAASAAGRLSHADFRHEGAQFRTVTVPDVYFPFSNAPGDVQQILQVNLPTGASITLRRRRSRKPDRSPIQLQAGWEIALAELRTWNPHARLGKEEFFGIQGDATSKILVRRYQLYDDDGSLLGRFVAHDIDQERRKVVVQPEDSSNPWRLYPQGDGVVWAAGPGQRRLAFDSTNGVLIGEQSGDSLIRYRYNNHGVLSQITAGESHRIDLIHGQNGRRIIQARSSTGQELSFVDAATERKESITAYDEALTTNVRVHLASTADYPAGTPEYIVRHADTISRLVTNSSAKRAYAQLLPDGGNTLLIVGRNVFPLPIARSRIGKELTLLANNPRSPSSTLTDVIRTAGKSLNPGQLVVFQDSDQQLQYHFGKVWSVSTGKSIVGTSNWQRADAHLSAFTGNLSGKAIQPFVVQESLQNRNTLQGSLAGYRNSPNDSPIAPLIAHANPNIGSQIQKLSPQLSGKFVILFICSDAGTRVERAQMYEDLVEKHGVLGIIVFDRLLDVEAVKEVIKELGGQQEVFPNFIETFRDVVKRSIERRMKEKRDASDLEKMRDFTVISQRMPPVAGEFGEA